jgi:peptide/nickel transport system permease protein
MNAITPPTSAAAVPAALPQAAAEHPAREALRMFLRNPSAIAGMAMLLAVLLVAIAGPWIWPADPFEIRTMPLSPPFSEEAWLGSDQLGRDVLTGIIHGGAPWRKPASHRPSARGRSKRRCLKMLP